MVSAIDATKPVDGIPAVKSELRGNLQTAATEITALQDGQIIRKPFSNAAEIFDGNVLDRTNEHITPQMFAPEGTIGQGAETKLSVTYGTVAEAQAAYPLIAAEIAANGDLSTISHDWAAFQSMSLFAQQQSSTPKQRARAGHYRITDTWKILDGNGVNCCDFEGDGQGYGDVIRATQIDASSFLDRPAVSIQGARASSFQQVAIRGGNSQAETLVNTSPFYHPDVSQYISPGVSSGRYNPYTGIAVDPYTEDPTGVGGTPYPNDPYGRSTTSMVSFRGVRVDGFLIGIGISNSDDNANADQITTDTCFFHYNTYALSSGGSQNRMLAANDSYIFGCHTAVTNRDFGKQNGNAWNINNMTLVQAFQIVDITETDPINFYFVHAEQFAKIGRFRGGPLGPVATWRNPHLKFFVSSNAAISNPANHYEASRNCTTIFDAAHFQAYVGPDAPNNGNFNFAARDGARISFTNGSNWYTPSFTGLPLIGYTDAQSQMGTMQDLYHTQESGVARKAQSLNEVQKYRNGTGLPNNATISNRIEAHWLTREVWNNNDKYLYVAGNKEESIAIPGESALTLGATTLSFDTTEPEAFRIGDWIAGNVTVTDVIDQTYTTPIAVVSGIAANTVTADLNCDAAEIDTPLAGLRLIQQREYAPLAAPQATCSTASADITFASSVSNIFNEGDWIQGDNGTWTRFRVNAISGDGLTVTLNKNAPITGTANMFWGRLSLVTSTPV